MGGVTIGGGGFSGDDQTKLNKRMQQIKDREAFDADIAEAKSNVRGLGPTIAAGRLAKRGVDIPGLTKNRLSEEDQGYKKGGKAKRYAQGGSVSSRADGCAQRGKTRGKVL